MKARQKNGNGKRQFHNGAQVKENKKMQCFIQNYMLCNVLYHMKIDAQPDKPSLNQTAQLPIFEHVFANPNALQNIPKPSLHKNSTAFKQTDNKTLFDTFNATDLSQNEDDQWLNYTKEYDALKKASSKKEQLSPQQHEKEMSLLINQFLYDIPTPSVPQTDTHQSKNRQTAVKVEKIQIDLNLFKMGKKDKSALKRTNDSVSLEKNKKQVTPRFININEMKAKLKKPQQRREKSASKKDIEVIKVANLASKANNHPFQRHIQRVAIAKNPYKIAKEQKQFKTQKEQHIQDKSKYSYSKNRATRQGKVSPVAQQTSQNHKKPLKIQIQIPAQELNLQQLAPPSQKESDLKQLDHESQQIIKDISFKVLTLLQKSKEMAWRGK